MAFDIERFMKFVRLATNNTNEHESKLAALKACKMIADNNYSIPAIVAPVSRVKPRPAQSSGDWQGFWTTKKEPPPKPKEPPKESFTGPTYTYTSHYYEETNPFNYDDLLEILKNLRKEVRKGTPEEKFSSNPNDYMYDQHSDLYINKFTGLKYTSIWYNENIKFKRPSQYPPPYSPYQSKPEDFFGGNRGGGKTTKSREEGKRGFNTKFGDVPRNLICKTCKQAKDTKFMGLETTFECNECQWTAFERREKK